MKKYLCILLAFVVIVTSFAQQEKTKTDEQRKMIHLLHANTLSKAADSERQILRGDVKFRQEGCYMYCDSAYFYQSSNSMSAFGNVKMEQGDTLFLYCDSLDYNGDTMYGQLYDHVHMIHRSKKTKSNTHLYTDYLTYDRDIEEAQYPETGVMVDSLVHLRSQIGWYYPNTQEAFFQFDVQGRVYERDSVWKSLGGMPPHIYYPDDKKLVPTHYLYSDTLRYNFENDLATVLGPSKIIKDSTTIHTRRGYFNTKSQQSTLYRRSYITSPGRYAIADTIFYDSMKGWAEARGHIHAVDTTDFMSVKGDYGYYIDNDSVAQSGYITGHALAMEYSNGDTLYLHADTLRAYTVINTIAKADTIFVGDERDIAEQKELARIRDSLAMAPLDSIMLYTDSISSVSDSISSTLDSISSTLDSISSVPDRLSAVDDSISSIVPDSLSIFVPDSVLQIASESIPVLASDSIPAIVPDSIPVLTSDSIPVITSDSIPVLSTPEEPEIVPSKETKKGKEKAGKNVKKKEPERPIRRIIPAHNDTLRFMQAYHGVRYYRSDLQGVCDSLIYSVKDTLATFVGNPVMWNSQYQITGDTIKAIVLKGGIKRAMIHPNAFLTQSHDESLAVDMDTLTERQRQKIRIDTLHYDQISGADLVCFFEEGKIKEMNMSGNVQIIYYPEEKDKTMIGLNQMVGNYLKVWFKEQKMEKLLLWPNVVGSLTPIQLVTDDILYLDGFRWMSYLRPKTPDDVLKGVLMKEDDVVIPVKLFDDDELNGY